MGKTLRTRRGNRSASRHSDRNIPRLSRDAVLYLFSLSHGTVLKILSVCCGDVVGARNCTVHADCHAPDERVIEEVGEGEGRGGVGVGWEGRSRSIVEGLEEVEFGTRCFSWIGCAVCSGCGGLVLISLVCR